MTLVHVLVSVMLKCIAALFHGVVVSFFYAVTKCYRKIM